jgi:hypothetical protein
MSVPFSACNLSSSLKLLLSLPLADGVGFSPSPGKATEFLGVEISMFCGKDLVLACGEEVEDEAKDVSQSSIFCELELDGRPREREERSEDMASVIIESLGRVSGR